MPGANRLDEVEHFVYILVVRRQDEYGSGRLNRNESRESINQVVMCFIAVDVIVNEIQDDGRRAAVIVKTAFELTCFREQEIALFRFAESNGCFKLDQFGSEMHGRIDSRFHHDQGAHGRARRFPVRPADVDHAIE